MAQQTISQKNLIQELGLEDLPEEKQIELLTSMTRVLIKRITLEVLEKLTEAERKEFDKVRESDDPEKVAKFLRDKIKNYDEMVEQIVKDFKNDMKGDLKNL